jgi:hypothetical protein
MRELSALNDDWNSPPREERPGTPGLFAFGAVSFAGIDGGGDARKQLS